jgi:hypothetical protein
MHKLGLYEDAVEMIRDYLGLNMSPWYRTMHWSVSLEAVLDVAISWLDNISTVWVLRSDRGRLAAVTRVTNVVDRLFTVTADHSSESLRMLLDRLIRRIDNRIAVIERFWKFLESQIRALLMSCHHGRFWKFLESQIRALLMSCLICLTQ